jgi:hypothetical protein
MAYIPFVFRISVGLAVAVFIFPWLIVVFVGAEAAVAAFAFHHFGFLAIDLFFPFGIFQVVVKGDERVS